MGYGPIVNGKQTPITPRENSWAVRVNDPVQQHVRDHMTREVTVIGTCDLDGSNFKPYDPPRTRRVPK